MARKLRRILTPEQFATILGQIADPTARLLVETAAETGLRWGELTELRTGDLDLTHRTVTVSRVVVELSGQTATGGERFVVKPYPKDNEWRRLSLSAHITDSLTRIPPPGRVTCCSPPRSSPHPAPDAPTCSPTPPPSAS